MHLPARAYFSGTVYVYAALWTLNYLYLWIGDTVHIEELKKEIDLYQNICDIMENTKLNWLRKI
jgi:hypothetical protein